MSLPERSAYSLPVAMGKRHPASQSGLRIVAQTRAPAAQRPAASGLAAPAREGWATEQPEQQVQTSLSELEHHERRQEPPRHPAAETAMPNSNMASLPDQFMQQAKVQKAQQQPSRHHQPHRRPNGQTLER
jgi:hypothetical protein